MANPSTRAACIDRFRASTAWPPARLFSDDIELRTAMILHSRSAGDVITFEADWRNGFFVELYQILKLIPCNYSHITPSRYDAYESEIDRRTKKGV
jgi:hypothetical protein